eukprot:CAMPEP_0183747336 /NCGR_PEP_ID=MMETSP0737-20130205/67214_1 /TAXON_ID=385413 /ORGANISM="Thalassiosira miniscula, Strain CCMP1093" /LENGTH=449 /DNA_ID=CAMNT_0025983045 /DNA_START=498 /DNA_END=1846 /DNA_ORIENTATION=-
MPPNTRIYLIHVGKTGGLTLLNVLGRGATGHELQCRMERTSRGTLDDECLSEKRKKGTELQRHIIGRYHVGSPRFSEEQKKWLLNNTNMFLFTIRDPLDRVRSAFNFHKYSLQKKGGYSKNQKDGLFYARCFPDSVNHMLQVLRTNTTSVDCARLGHDALRGHMRGRGGGGNHFFYNYQKYRKYTLGSHPLDHAIAVIRTEHLWEDTIALDKELGGSGDFGKQEGRQETHGSETFASNSTELTSANAAYLCCVIYREIEVYQELILKAVNLNVDEKHDDIMKLMAHCQINVPAENTVDFVSDPYSWSDFSNGDGCKIVQQFEVELNYKGKAVIRTEHLWEDTIALDKELGGSGDFGEQEGRKETHGSETFDSNATLLTSANAAYLCCAIYREIEVYQELILKAVNLNVDEKHDDIMKLMAHCQINVPAENTVDFVSDPYSWSDFSNGDG